MSRLHIVFGHSGAGTLRLVLGGRRLDDKVVAFGDDLSWGPIGDDRLDQRSAYFNREDPFPLDQDFWGGLRASHEEFWRDAAQPADERLIWLGSGDAREAAAYLAYLDKLSDLPAAVIRPDDHLPPHPHWGPHGSIGVLNPEEVTDCLDRASRRPVSDDSAQFGRWAELVSENAMLRVLRDGHLVSTPVDYYDHYILTAAGPEWMRHVRVIGHALGKGFDDRVRLNSEFLFSRLFHLVDAGVLEADGDVRAWTDEPRRSDARVRLAQR